MLSTTPIKSVKIFTVAAQYLSFSQSAEALNVTPGAVSRMVKKLEEYLGTKLFNRTAKGLLLTEEGEALFAEVTEPFAEIDHAVERIKKSRSNRPVRVFCHPTFATRWLLPRWSNFYEQNSDIEVQITTTLDVIDLSRNTEADIVIQLDGGLGDKPASLQKVKSDYLLDIDIIPVCSPDIFPAHMDPYEKVRFLHDQLFIHIAALPHEWQNWLAAYAESEEGETLRSEILKVNCDQGPVFQTLDLAIKAAQEGVGIAVVFKKFVEDELKSGRLINPFSYARRSNRSFHVQSHISKAQNTGIRTYRKWLLSEAGH